MIKKEPKNWNQQKCKLQRFPLVTKNYSNKHGTLIWSDNDLEKIWSSGTSLEQQQKIISDVIVVLYNVYS